MSPDMPSLGREEERVECSVGNNGSTFDFLVVSFTRLQSWAVMMNQVCTHKSSLEIMGSNGRAFICARYTSRTESHGASSSVTSSAALSSDVFTPTVAQ